MKLSHLLKGYVYEVIEKKNPNNKVYYQIYLEGDTLPVFEINNGVIYELYDVTRQFKVDIEIAKHFVEGTKIEVD